MKTRISLYFSIRSLRSSDVTKFNSQ